MKTNDFFIMLAMIVVLAVGATWSCTARVMFLEGAKTARLYYEATQSFPSETWLRGNSFRGYESPEEILEGLVPY